jgi:hypothetical protein
LNKKGDEMMYHQEHTIAQAEHAVFLARFYRPATEGITVRVPNIFERKVTSARNVLARGSRSKRKVMLAQKAPAR